MESKELKTEQPHSVEISINQKGNYSGKVKVYDVTIDGAYEKALEKVKLLDKLISEKNGKD